ncbi:acetyl-CoA carboxylase, putative [Plasmodium relictum]|uniref:Acetyl-CoA carboxylase, putative n=1 Tax=Plasmodium relictum TaxID=85471 RepID=A0A1J1H8J0_PLARL|nr:acetyl-CoA carboxylase, putative [Plasmodium relictum]CRH01227.1 acetyl-CoA carboxylase, putative [Plasmodium relictum]
MELLCNKLSFLRKFYNFRILEKFQKIHVFLGSSPKFEKKNGILFIIKKDNNYEISKSLDLFLNEISKEKEFGNYETYLKMLYMCIETNDKYVDERMLTIEKEINIYFLKRYFFFHNNGISYINIFINNYLITNILYNNYLHFNILKEVNIDFNTINGCFQFNPYKLSVDNIRKENINKKKLHYISLRSNMIFDENIFDINSFLKNRIKAKRINTPYIYDFIEIFKASIFNNAYYFNFLAFKQICNISNTKNIDFIRKNKISFINYDLNKCHRNINEKENLFHLLNENEMNDSLFHLNLNANPLEYNSEDIKREILVVDSSNANVKKIVNCEEENNLKDNAIRTSEVCQFNNTNSAFFDYNIKSSKYNIEDRNLNKNNNNNNNISNNQIHNSYNILSNYNGNYDLSSTIVLNEYNKIENRNESVNAFLFFIKTKLYSEGRKFIILIDNVIVRGGSYGYEELNLLKNIFDLIIIYKIPLIYIANNSGAEIKILDILKNNIKVKWINEEKKNEGIEYFYVEEDGYEKIKNDIVFEKIIENNKKKYIIRSILGKNNEYGSTNLKLCSNLIKKIILASENSVLISYVSSRCVGFCTLLLTICKRIIQKKNSTILLLSSHMINIITKKYTNFNKRNKYEKENLLIGGDKIMEKINFSKMIVGNDYDGITNILSWINYTKDLNKEFSKQNYMDNNIHNDNVNRRVKDLFSSDGIFDKNSITFFYNENLKIGRSTLGGIPVSFISVVQSNKKSKKKKKLKINNFSSINNINPLENDTVQQRDVDLNMKRKKAYFNKENMTKISKHLYKYDNILRVLIKKEKKMVMYILRKKIKKKKKNFFKEKDNNNNVKLLNSKEAKIIAAFLDEIKEENIPIFLLLDLNGIDTRKNEVENDILSSCITIVKNIMNFRNIIYIYIINNKENSFLRGAAYVLFEKSLNKNIEIYCTSKSESSIISDECICELKYNKKDVTDYMINNDVMIINLLNKKKETIDNNQIIKINKKIEELKKKNFPFYLKAFYKFINLHHNSIGLKTKMLVDDIVEVENSRSFFYNKLVNKLKIV